MNAEPTIRDSIDDAATSVGSLWPLHSFVTANPLSGFEDQPFGEAVEQAANLLGGRGYPSAETFETALDRGQIDPERLRTELAEAGYEGQPRTLLDRLADTDTRDGATDTATDHVDRVLTKWLSAFLDEGTAHWSMPNREAGFYAAFADVAEHDGEVPAKGLVAALPETPVEAIGAALEPYPERQWVSILEEQLAALPGWTGFIKQRAADDSAWQSTYPVSLAGYLAARLALLDAVGADIEPDDDAAEVDPADELAQAFLRAWEATYRDDLVGAVAAESRSVTDSERPDRPAAQLVFCIDTRSERIRRHTEAVGDYETHGYAGFFGVPMEYRGYDTEVSVDACPPVLDPQHRITDVPTDADTRARHDRWSGLRAAADELIETLEANAATAYSYVETAGSAYGLSLAARTLLPGRVHDLFDAADESVPADHEFCEPRLRHQPAADDLPAGLTVEERVEYATTAFELMGWERFGRLVVFAGHASETANNPDESSLDCGACAGNPGGPSARVLAAICGDPQVQTKLRDRGFDIPEDTVFLAGQHNTTTGEVELYAEGVPESHADDLDGRAFLHSYDWSTDPDGDALEAILTGPLVVTQWINTQYYFSTVDNAVYGSGSKITHNPVGNVGVYQGNGGNLMTGLPLQSLMAADGEPHHQPLRLSTVIHAPVERVTDVLADHEELTELLDNDWLSLTVVDPTQDHSAFHYAEKLRWRPWSRRPDALQAEPAAPTTVDD